MSEIVYHKATRNTDNKEFVTIFSSLFEQPLVALSDNPNYNEIVECLEKVEKTSSTELKALAERIEGLVDMSIHAKREFQRITDRVSIADGIVTFDGDVVDNSITQQIIRFIKEGEDFGYLAKFMENLYSNPNEHSREQLYGWLKNNNFSISEEGEIVAYKGVNSDFTSWHKGPAIVDGKEVEHAINKPGSVVEMPRSEVNHDPSIGCSIGLHAANYNYAQSYGSKIVEIRVNPRDVVSVPTEASEQKMRACRYRVVDVVREAYTSAVVRDPKPAEKPKAEVKDGDKVALHKLPVKELKGLTIKERGKNRPAREITSYKSGYVNVKRADDDSKKPKISKIKRENLKRYDLVAS